MSIDQRGRDAAADLLARTQPDVARALRNLHRLRRRRNARRSLALVAALLVVVVGLGWVSVRGDQRESGPIDRGRGVRNGILLSIDQGWLAQVGVAPRDAFGRMPAKVSPDSLIAFNSSGSQLLYQNRSEQVVAMDVHDGGTRVLTACPADPPCDFGLSPDGRTITFHARGGLELRDLVTGTSTTLRAPTGASWPRWSPDGREIAFSTPAGMQVIRPDGTGLRMLYPTPAHRRLVPGITWSPDGRALAFMRADETVDSRGGAPESTFTLMTVRRDGTEARELQDAGRCVCVGIPSPTVTWSPDGSEIAFSRVRPIQVYGASNVDGTYAVRPDGTGLRKVGTPGALIAWQPLPPRS